MKSRNLPLLPRAGAALLLIGLLCGGPAPARAMVSQSGDTVAIPPSRTIDDDAAVAGNTVNVAGHVRGDLAAAAGNVLITGTTDTDVLAAGQTVTVQGTVSGSLRAAAANLVIDAPIGRSLTACGGTVLVQKPSQVGRNAALAGGQVSIYGRVARDLRVAASQAVIGGPVEGSVAVWADRVTVGPEAAIHGDLDVYGARPPEMAPGSLVQGKIRFHPTGETAAGGGAQATPLAHAGAWVASWVLSAAALFLLGAVVLSLFPRGFVRTTETLRRSAGRSALYGFLEMVAVPAAALLLMVTLVGMPLGFTLLALYAVSLLISGAVTAYPLGAWALRWLRHPESSPYVSLAAGSLLITLLAALPYLGGLIRLAVLLLGSGALLLGIQETRSAAAATAAPAATER